MKTTLFSQLLHGGDYNPDQWIDDPEIIAEDIHLMKKAHINCVTLGIFSWSRLEPSEGVFNFDYMEELIDTLYANGIYTILATPTGAMPRWLTDRYEEVNKMEDNGVRRIHGQRHNFCPTSRKMRQAMKRIDTELAKRFGKKEAVIAWHISNEYGGGAKDCHCPQCEAAFQMWLGKRYRTIDEINHAWWTDFWSNRINDWSEIHSPVPHGEHELKGLVLDWKRFVSDQMIDFAREEVETVKAYSDIPCVTNLMGAFKPIDYFKLAKVMDIVSLDSYPFWHALPTEQIVSEAGSFGYALTRSLKKQPFLLMESVPSVVNWMPRCSLKRPGMHELSSLQAIAGGSNSVQYFQWRKGRGGSEKYHGAVIDHKNGGNTRVFRDVENVGKRLAEISDVVLKTVNQPRVALVYDWENMWALDECADLLNPMDAYHKWMPYYQAFARLGVDVDIVNMDDPLEGYDLVVAPLNYMYRGNYVENVKRYVKNGGCYVTTYFSGEVNETDLCFIKEHPLMDVLGVRMEEIDVRPSHVENHILFGDKAYAVEDLCAIVHAQEAKVLAVYESDFYAGYPALTRNTYGKGTAYFMAAEGSIDYITDVYKMITEQTGTANLFVKEIPAGVLVNTRNGADGDLVFLQNFQPEEVTLKLQENCKDIETGEQICGDVILSAYQCRIIECIRR